jgi:hypothetical protein
MINKPDNYQTKAEVVPVHSMKAVPESRIWFQSFLIATLEGRSILLPGRFTPRKDEEAG